VWPAQYSGHTYIVTVTMDIIYLSHKMRCSGKGHSL
jgi:hypothetical protein